VSECHSSLGPGFSWQQEERTLHRWDEALLWALAASLLGQIDIFALSFSLLGQVLAEPTVTVATIGKNVLLPVCKGKALFGLQRSEFSAGKS